jgi:hypothetical protein
MADKKLEYKKLTVLTAAEDYSWCWAWAFYVGEGHSDEEAAELAWKDVQIEFPRLRTFYGCPAKCSTNWDAKWSMLPVVERKPKVQP